MSELTKILGMAINTLLINHDIDTQVIKTEEVDFTIGKIESKIVDLLPKEKIGDTEREDYTGNCDDDYDKGVSNGEQWGWNSYRQSLLKILKGELNAISNKNKEI